MFAVDFRALANAGSQAALEVRTVALACEIILLKVHEVTAFTRLAVDEEPKPFSFQWFYFQKGVGSD